jgi:flagellar protein FlaJ
MIRKIPTKIKEIVETILDPTSRENIITILFSFTTKLVDKEKYRQTLNGATISKSYHTYVPLQGFYATIVAVIASIVIGLIVPFILTLVSPLLPDITTEPIVESIELPFSVPVETPSLLTDIGSLTTAFIIDNIVIIAQVLSSLVFGVIIWYIVFVIGLYWPKYVKSERERKIEKYYSISVLYLYALTTGGRSIYEAIKMLKDQEEIFGEVSREAQTIYRRIHFRNVDLLKALRIQARETPSDKLADMYIELASTIEQGASVSSYLKERSKQAEREEKRKQEQNFELLEILSEVLMIIIVAPTLLVIIGLAGSFIGGGVAKVLDVSAVIPLAVAIIFGAVIYGLFSELDPPTEKMKNAIPNEYSGMPDYPDEIKGWELQRRLQDFKITTETFTHNPITTFGFTIPVVLVYSVIANPLRIPDLLISEPVTVGLFYIWIPLVITFLPFTILYEIRERKRTAVRKRIRPILREVAESNKRGNTIPKAFKKSTEEQNNELEKTIYKEFQSRELMAPILTSNVFERIGNSYQSDRLRIAMKTLSDAQKETGDITDVVERLVNNLERKEEADALQKQQGRMYSVIMLFTSLIAMGILAVLDIQFLTVIEDIISQAGDTRAGLGIGDIPLDKIRAVMFFISFNTMFAVGVIMGLLINNKISSTLKFIIVLTMIPIGIFFFI